MSHSKKNNTRAFFTAHERAELKGQWGANSTRLTRESFLPFGSCNLCLVQAEDPVACPDEGHIFCRECALSNLLAQTKEIKRLQKAARKRAVDDAEEQDLKTAEAQYKELDSFEKAQMGLDVTTSHTLKRGRGVDDAGQQSKRRKSQDNAENKDTSFWIPSQTGDSKVEAVKVSKKHPTCPIASSQNVHDLSLKNLIDIRFVKQDSKGSQDKAYMCPSCNKTLSNSTKGLLAKACGHVLCKACSERFQSPDQDQETPCFTCNTPISVGKGVSSGGAARSGLIMLKSDATGFAGAGNNTVKKEGLAFQFG